MQLDPYLSWTIQANHVEISNVAISLRCIHRTCLVRMSLSNHASIALQVTCHQEAEAKRVKRQRNRTRPTSCAGLFGAPMPYELVSSEYEVLVVHPVFPSSSSASRLRR